MITAIVGSMFSEKTTELIRRGRRAKRAGERVVFIKPALDNRYSETKIVSHDGVEVDSILIGQDGIDWQEIADNYDVVCVDEVQFLDMEHLRFLIGMAEVGIHVITAGLDMSYDAKPFQMTMLLMVYAEEVVKLQAVCGGCGEDAWISYRKTESTETIELGSDEEYTPLCRTCYVTLMRAEQETEQDEK